jgi:phosphoribosyl 1,2-cyclic phosphodiesterase
MIINCWGSRGSIPVSGREYFKYGGDTTCLEIRTQSGHIIIVDAGTGVRRLGKKLIEDKRYEYHFIFTHAHWDHLMGFPFFAPLYYRRAKFWMHRCPFHSKFVETMLSKVMAPPNFPVKYTDLKAKMIYEQACPQIFEIGSVTVIPIPLSHPNSGSGYKFVEDGKSFVFLTDNELGFSHPGAATYNNYVAFAEGTDLLFHDAEYTPEEYKTYIEWGHSKYTDVLDLTHRAGVSRLGLFHLNQERTDEDMDRIVGECGKIIHKKNYNMDCFPVGRDMTFEL